MFLPFPFFPNPMSFWVPPLPWDPFASNAWRSRIRQSDKKDGESPPEQAERQQAQHEQPAFTQQYHSQDQSAGVQHQGYGNIQARWHPVAFQKPSVAALGSMHEQIVTTADPGGQTPEPNRETPVAPAGGQWRSDPQPAQAPVTPVAGVSYPTYPGMPHGARERWTAWW